MPIELTTQSELVAELGDVRVIAQSRVLRVWSSALKNFGLGFIWNRPIAITVETARTSESVPVRDVTREWIWLLLGIGLAGSLAIRAVLGRRT